MRGLDMCRILRTDTSLGEASTRYTSRCPETSRDAKWVDQTTPIQGGV